VQRRTTLAAGLTVPFNRPRPLGRETQYLVAATNDGPLSGDGPFTRRATDMLVDLVGAPAALLTTSCTHALDMTAILLDVGPGDEVIVPSFTFCSVATAYALRGATPVFVDCRPDTLNVDERLIERAVTDRTRAIVVMHYAGVSCEMREIAAIAARHGLVIVEDNAHGLGGTFTGRPLGSFGALATQSFHETKNVQCGEGGALVFNDERYLERAEIIREKGTNRSQFFRGMVDKYRWMDVGSSYLLSDLLAAFLTAQLERFDESQRDRMYVWRTYHDELADWAVQQGVIQPTVADDRTHPAHLYHLLMPDLRSRQAIIAHLAERGVQATFHYQPLHSSPAGRRFGRTAPGGCPVTENVADRLVRLPMFAAMTPNELDHVVASVQSFTLPG
jgi:dTDP-4-amino-4,6-dideoxygalactose transaminase